MLVMIVSLSKVAELIKMLFGSGGQPHVDVGQLDNECIRSLHPPDVTNSTQQGHHTAVMRAVAASSVTSCLLCHRLSVFVTLYTDYAVVVPAAMYLCTVLCQQLLHV